MDLRSVQYRECDRWTDELHATPSAHERNTKTKCDRTTHDVWVKSATANGTHDTKSETKKRPKIFRTKISKYSNFVLIINNLTMTDQKGMQWAYLKNKKSWNNKTKMFSTWLSEGDSKTSSRLNSWLKNVKIVTDPNFHQIFHKVK